MRFGTDGVRGVANRDISVEDAVMIGRAAATVLGDRRFLIGRDTRRSGPMLESALAAGLASAGVDVELLGVLPTPGVAAISRATGHPAAVISASHNPFADNGIKLFAAGGTKLSDATQAELEAAFERKAPVAPVGVEVGVVTASGSDRATEYLDSLVESLGGRRLGGLRVVLDSANGAASALAAPLFERLGALVVSTCDEPDGVNINVDCGSTQPEALARRVVEEGCDVGFAFDGDADRLIAVGSDGRIVDGDHLIAILASDLAARGRLRGNTVVVTVMSNLGLRRSMHAAGIDLVETAVGDRYVLEALDSGGYSLGGEQSGHLILADVSTTGDGMLAAAHVADVIVRSGKGLHELSETAMTRVPQVLRNVTLTDRRPDLHERLAELSSDAGSTLGDEGRVLIRASGTEPLVRVMVEALDADVAAQTADRLCAQVEALMGAPGRP